MKTFAVSLSAVMLLSVEASTSDARGFGGGGGSRGGGFSMPHDTGGDRGFGDHSFSADSHPPPARPAPQPPQTAHTDSSRPNVAQNNHPEANTNARPDVNGNDHPNVDTNNRSFNDGNVNHTNFDNGDRTNINGNTVIRNPVYVNNSAWGWNHGVAWAPAYGYWGAASGETSPSASARRPSARPSTARLCRTIPRTPRIRCSRAVRALLSSPTIT